MMSGRQSLLAVVGFLAAVEVASGVLQGYYTPILPQIAEHLSIAEGDVNWFEAGQLVVSALCVPVLSRLGDIVGHQRVLLLATTVTAAASWAVAVAPSFTTFLLGWSLQGAYVVWLPLEIAIVHRRTADSGAQDVLTRRAAAVLVGVLELSVIVGALTSGALAERLDMNVVLALPAVVVTVVLAVIWVGVEHQPGTESGGLDWGGLGLITLVLGLVMGGMVVLRLDGLASSWAWLLIASGVLALIPFARYELGLDELDRHAPLVDVRLLARPSQWPVQLTAFLFGVPVLGGQIPLSTFAQADPAERGYGFGASAAVVSTFVGLYVISMAIGALSLPLITRWLGTRGALIAASTLVAIGYLLWIPFHNNATQGLTNMALAGLGSGVLVAALPAAAAAAAPAERTGFATGMTNATKTVGGAVASSIFALALTGSATATGPGHATLTGYLVVWGVCGAAAALAALALALAPRSTAILAR